MLLGEVHIPSEVLTAWEAGRLVIFTGAGISVSAPSGLPSFAGLATDVRRITQSALDPSSDEWKDQLDAYMGLLDESEDVDVHRLVQTIITPVGSRPNANHEALAQIAAKFGTRIITTNYDQHLEKVLRAMEAADAAAPLEVFQAPALPLGNDFAGLVYLHGCASDEARRLVVTDRDFSHAYFHEAWATRFLERMFRTYDVLFVGYSHSDVVMKYLGLGLDASSRRYVLTDQPDLETWARLRITPLPYAAGRHDILTDCLLAWAAHGSRGLLEHRQRIRDLVSTPSQPTPEELSYLEESIDRADRVRFFGDFATDVFWLKWASEQPAFARLFQPDAPQSDVDFALAYWFAQRFAAAPDEGADADERPSDAAWRIFASAGGRLSTTAWNEIGRAVLGFTGTCPPHVLRWLWVLMEQERPGSTLSYIDMAIEYDGAAEDPMLFLALLRHLMSARLVAETGYWGPGQMNVKTRGELHWLQEGFKKLPPDVPENASRLLPIVEAALLAHLDLEARVTSNVIGYTRRRKAIQPHPQDQYPEPIDAIIDAVRDAAVTLWPSQPDYLHELLRRWLTSEHTLMRRIAIHVAGEEPGATGNDRIQFVLDCDLADESGVAQEVLQLIMRAAPDADTAIVDRLVEHWMPVDDETRNWYRALSKLEALERVGVATPRFVSAIATVRSHLPDDTQVSPYPGLAGWHEAGIANGEQPLTVADFEQMIHDTPADAAAFILSFEERTFPRSGETSREDAISMLRQTVVQQPEAGVELWPHITGQPDLQRTVVAAWGEAKEPEQLEAIMKALTEADLAPILGGLGQFLMHAERHDAAAWDTIPATALFIEKAWAAANTDESYVPGRESNQHWISKSYNEPAGLLTEFWFEMFRRRWTAAGDTWRGLSDDDKHFLDRALEDRTERGALAQTLIAGRIHFLDAADSAWCATALLPRLAWSDPSVSEPIWWGVLFFARWNERLVANGLLDGLIEVTAHLDAFDDDCARRWATLLASIAARSEVRPAVTWVETLTAKASPSQRTRWIEAVEDDLSESEPVTRAQVWRQWLAHYWRHRAGGSPVTLSQSEANALAVAACHLTPDDFTEAVTLVEATSAALDSHGEAAFRLSDELIDATPQDAARFLIHLMNRTPAPFYGGYHLQPKLKRVVEHPGDWKALRESALRLGITNL